MDMNDVASWAGGQPVAAGVAPAAAVDPDAAAADAEPEDDGPSGCLHAIVADLQGHVEKLSGLDVTDEDKGTVKKLKKLKDELSTMAEDVQSLAEDYDKAHEGDEDEDEEEEETVTLGDDD